MFKTGGTLYYIALQVDANDIPEWFHASEADRTDPLWLNNPVFTFSLETYTVLADGTYDAQAKTWTYKGDTYSFRITQEGTKNIAVAFKP
ncbi:MAG: hypothetical protein OEY14_17155 [Myxococcales bacterium]|nr:hypothetical protein [Myxococcales bacterium]